MMCRLAPGPSLARGGESDYNIVGIQFSPRNGPEQDISKLVLYDPNKLLDGAKFQNFRILIDQGFVFEGLIGEYRFKLNLAKSSASKIFDASLAFFSENRMEFDKSFAGACEVLRSNETQAAIDFIRSLPLKTRH